MLGSVRLAQGNPDVLHPKLPINVCSPGGSSIVGVNEMIGWAYAGPLSTTYWQPTGVLLK